ncbi:MAG: uncharacterized protein JWO03_1145 [Bacteroidetes bacterium]|nr:uncharacterized protein [Bacteroidota bacterium]
MMNITLLYPRRDKNTFILLWIMDKEKAISVTIVKATDRDREFFRKVHHESYRESIEAIFGWDEEIQYRFADADFDTRNIHIILWDERPCGVVGWRDNMEETELGPLYLLAQYQGQGIGTKIVQGFIEGASERKALLKLKPLRSNLRARRLYERLGFNVTSGTDQYWFMEHRPISQ